MSHNVLTVENIRQDIESIDFLIKDNIYSVDNKRFFKYIDTYSNIYIDSNDISIENIFTDSTYKIFKSFCKYEKIHIDSIYKTTDKDNSKIRLEVLNGFLDDDVYSVFRYVLNLEQQITLFVLLSSIRYIKYDKQLSFTLDELLQNIIVSRFINVFDSMGDTFIPYKMFLEILSFEIKPFKKLLEKNKINNVTFFKSLIESIKNIGYTVEKDIFYKVIDRLVEKSFIERLDDKCNDKVFLLGDNSISDENVFKIIHTDKKLMFLAGDAGTGKSTTIKNLIKTIVNKDDVFIYTPTHTAKNVLINFIGNDLSDKNIDTLYQLRKFKSDKTNKILIVDEASMIDNKSLRTIHELYNTFNKIIFVGDNKQLPPVGKGHYFYRNFLNECDNRIVLTKNYRNTDKTIITARHILNKNHMSTDDICNIYDIDVWINNNRSKLEKFNWETSKIITFTNEDVERLNILIYEMLFNTSYNKASDVFIVYEGMQVISEVNMPNEDNNDEDSNVYKYTNKEFFKVLNTTISGEVTLFSYDTKKVIKVDMNEFKYNFKLNYALTIHKSQGKTFENVIMYLNNTTNSYFSKELLYTGITRPTKIALVIFKKRDIITLFNEKRNTFIDI